MRLLPKSGGVRALLVAIVLGVPAVAGWRMLRKRRAAFAPDRRGDAR